MLRIPFVALVGVVCASFAGCGKPSRPAVGPAPTDPAAAQLALAKGVWTLSPSRAGGDAPPFTQITITVNGAAVTGVAEPGGVKFTASTEYQRPRPGGGRLRLTASIPRDGGAVTMVADWGEDAREGNAGWFSGGGLKQQVGFVATPVK